jgi:preprotein translocase SecE subunit
VARDRKRSKQRRNRGGAAGAGGQPDAASGQPEQPVDPSEKPIDPLYREDVPGSLEHSSGADDEFDAAIVVGAKGVPASPEVLSEAEIEAEAENEGDLKADELQETGPGGAVLPRAATPEQASGAPQAGGNRAIGFLRASWAELHRVQWPDRRQVSQATAVVIGFVAIAGAYLGLADVLAKEIVEFIL